MKRLKVGVIDLITNTTEGNWFQTNVMQPEFAAIMPQCVAVWAEELGCEVFYETFTGPEDLLGCMPGDLDILFISCFSRSSFLAYGVSAAYRRRGAVTVLGGPHARSFPEHSLGYFDYVCQLTDQELIKSLLKDFAPQRRGVLLNAAAQPKELPKVRQRARFIDVGINKGTRFFKVVPMIGSLGCPYTCSFCIDAPIPYNTLPYADLIDDLRFSKQRWGADVMVGWHDPNFGVRFKDYMGLIEESGTELHHIAESSMSLLGEENLKALRKNNFVAILPGIESWYEFNAKAGQTKRAGGMEKVARVAEHINQIQSYIFCVQANFVLGLDSDVGAEPWELTKRFLDLSPGAIPAYSIVTDFQNAPLSDSLKQEKRTTYVPYPLLDNNFAFNVKLKNYGPLEFYDRLIDLMEHSWSLKALARRFMANPHWLVKGLNLGRGFTEGKGRLRHHKIMRARLANDRDFLRFVAGDRELPPAFFFEAIRQQAGRYAELLPRELLTPAGFVASVKRPAESAGLPA
jgi:hypothetical protein